MAYINGKKVLNMKVNVSGFDEDKAKELTVSNEPYNNKKVNDESNIVGYKGYHMIQGTEMLSADKKTIDIELRDAELEEKAVDYYSVGDLVNIEANTHLYQKQKIVAITPNGLGRGNTVITLAEVDGANISFQLEAEDELENWIYVADKYVGEQIPQFSHAVAGGIDTVAAGYAAFAGGRNNKAYGNYGFAIGRKTTAAYLGVATGLETKALAIGSKAHGRWTEATGENSVALGQSSKSIGHTSLATGLATQAAGDASTSLGTNTLAEGGSSIAAGSGSIAKGKSSFALGSPDHASVKVQAKANQSVALGQGTVAGVEGETGKNSIATGYQTEAKGNNSISLGYQTKATAENSFAAGELAQATEKNTVAFGQNTLSKGFCTFVSGRNSSVKGVASSAFGEGCDVKGSRSFGAGIGVSTNANVTGQVALGKYNEAKDNTILEVGNGTADNPHTAFSVNQDGSITVGQTKITEEQLIKLLALIS